MALDNSVAIFCDSCILNYKVEHFYKPTFKLCRDEVKRLVEIRSALYVRPLLAKARQRRNRLCVFRNCQNSGGDPISKNHNFN
jgi:hypothetical protein